MLQTNFKLTTIYMTTKLIEKKQHVEWHKLYYHTIYANAVIVLSYYLC